MSVEERIDPTWIVDHYKRLRAASRIPLDVSLEVVTLTNTGHGLGDTMMLTDLPRVAAVHGQVASVFSQSKHFRPLMAFNPHFADRVYPFWAAADRLCGVFDLGNGHTIQRIRRAFGYPVEDKPAGCLVVPAGERFPRRFVLHFEPGQHAHAQRTSIHPHARRIYPKTLEAIAQFVHDHPEYEFFEIGSSKSSLPGVHDATGLGLASSIELIASSQYFVGIISGPLHVAAALGLRLITIVNFPEPASIVLPTLKDTGQVESEWLYPQAVVLHQEGEGGTTYELSTRSLERAVAGELYPYWSDDYLVLIHT